MPKASLFPNVVDGFMAENCAAAFERLGLDPARTINVLHGFPDRLKKLLEKRVGSREAVRSELAQLIHRLWKHKAMKFTEHSRVENVTRAVITLTAPDAILPKLDYRSVINLAEELAEERASKQVAKGSRLSRSAHSRSRGRSRPQHERAAGPVCRTSSIPRPVRVERSRSRLQAAPSVAPERRSGRSQASHVPVSSARSKASAAPTPRTARLRSPLSRSRRCLDLDAASENAEAPVAPDVVTAPGTPPASSHGSLQSAISKLLSVSPRTQARMIEAIVQPNQQGRVVPTIEAPTLPAPCSVSATPPPIDAAAPVPVPAQPASSTNACQEVSSEVLALVPCQSSHEVSGTLPAPPRFPHADRWSALRDAKPAVDPSILFQRLMMEKSGPISGPEVQEFEFASNAETDDGKMWDFFHMLARLSPPVLVQELYVDTPWQHRINAKGAEGTEYVTAVKIAPDGPTLNWWLRDDGRIRIDGKKSVVEAFKPRLRVLLPKYVRGQTLHSQYTGRVGKSSRPRLGQFSRDAAARQERQGRIRGQVLVLPQTVIFCPQGKQGVWDVLESAIGVRNVPDNKSIPWSMFLRNGAVLQIWADGRVKATSSLESIDNLDEVESVLVRQLGAHWEPTTSVFQSNRPLIVGYGVKGPRARDRSTQPELFH